MKKLFFAVVVALLASLFFSTAVLADDEENLEKVSQRLEKILMEKMGDRFNEFFEVESSRKVTENFDEEIYKRFDADTVQDIKVYVKQSKPSIR